MSWNLEWEEVPSTDKINRVERARVPGGWLVRLEGSNSFVHPELGVVASAGWGIFTYVLCFVPDPPEIYVEVRDVSQEG